MNRSCVFALSRWLPGIAAICFYLMVGAGAGIGVANADAANYDIDGYLFATGEASDFAETSALKVRRTSMVATFAARDEASPLHLATYSCAFVSHTTTDTETRHQSRVGLTGACLVTDRTGDSHVAEWHRTPGEEAGTWSIVRGSGKYEAASGAGSYTITFLSGPPDIQLRFALSGQLILE